MLQGLGIAKTIAVTVDPGPDGAARQFAGFCVVAANPAFLAAGIADCDAAHSLLRS